MWTAASILAGVAMRVERAKKLQAELANQRGIADVLSKTQSMSTASRVWSSARR